MISIGKYGTYDGSQSTSIIHYYLYHSSTIVQPYAIEHNTNVLMNCLQKYQGTGFNSVGSV